MDEFDPVSTPRDLAGPLRPTHSPLTPAGMSDCFTGGFVQTNGYLFQSPDQSWILVDAPKGIAEWLMERQIKPSALLLTHQHFDHVEDAAAVAAMGAKIYSWFPYSTDLTLESMMRDAGMPIAVPPYKVDTLLEDEKSLEIGGQTIELAHVPGHSSDSVAFFLRDKGQLYSGDTLMRSSLGRADLPGGNPTLLIDGIREKILTLPLETIVSPGHGGLTSIGSERAGNPYCGD